jgi:ABC-type nickel/cobalt efflux system permease component RcnA
MNVIGAALLGAGGFFLIWRTWREYRRVQARHNAENRDAGPEEDI